MILQFFVFFIMYNLTALLFYLLGKYSHTYIERDVFRKVTKKHIKPGVLGFKSTAEIEYEKTVDKQIEEEWKRFAPPTIRHE